MFHVSGTFKFLSVKSLFQLYLSLLAPLFMIVVFLSVFQIILNFDLVKYVRLFRNSLKPSSEEKE